jgi:competence protein ComEA
MLKRFLVIFAVLLAFSFSAFAADANTASQAELEAIKGIGPAISAKIIEERNKAPFKDWEDLVTRVKGIGETSAGKLSTAGLTVNGGAYSAATTPKATTTTKAAPATKMTPAATATPAATPTPATPATPAKPATYSKMSTTAAAASEPASPVKASPRSKKAASAASAAASK